MNLSRLHKMTARTMIADRFTARTMTAGATAWLAVLACVVMIGCAGRASSGYGVSGTDNAAALARQESADPTLQPRADSREFYLSLIGKMQSEGLYFASLAHIDEFEKKFGATPEVENMRANALRQTGQAEASEQAYRGLLSTPLAASGYHGLGLLAARRGDFDAAAVAFNNAATRMPTDALYLSDLGFAQLCRQDLPAARVPIAQAAELAPTNPKVLGNLALYLILARDRPQANAVMERAALPPATRTAVQQLAQQIETQWASRAQASRVAAQTVSSVGAKASPVSSGVSSGVSSPVPMQPMLNRFGGP
jgi:Flp pilus assembly protein TadD